MVLTVRVQTEGVLTVDIKPEAVFKVSACLV